LPGFWPLSIQRKLCKSSRRRSANISTAEKAKEAIQEATRVEEAEDNELSELSDDEVSDEDIDVEMGDV